jgi:phage shock protein PspC (stress-responsive transcriptional regulator)
MIGIMGRPEDIDDGYYDENFTEPGVKTQRRLYRNPDEQIIAGVAGGIGAYTNIDPVWIRLLFIVTTIFWGFGFFVYIALWVALPMANDHLRMLELYGYNRGNRGSKGNMRGRGASGAERIGGALNEIFRAIMNIIRLVFRIILITIGAFLIFMGFSFLALLVAALFFNFGPWLPDAMTSQNINFIDLLPLVINPAAVPWVKILSIFVITLPLVGLVYWGLKLIFRFRVKDGIISIVALGMWVIASFALTMMLVNQGVSFAESGTKVERIDLGTPGDSLYLAIGRDLALTEYEKKIPVPFDDNFVFYTTTTGKIYCSAEINIFPTEEGVMYMEIERNASGATRRIAVEKAEKIEYSYSLRNNTLFADSYFGLPESSRWNGSIVNVNIYLPEGSTIFIDKSVSGLIGHASNEDDYSWEMGGKWWTMDNELLTTIK